MARPRAADYDTQRDRILTRAVEAFARTGYAAASMSMLAAACKVSKATLYHYYPSKQALLFEALDRYTRRLVALLDTAAAQADITPRERLRTTLRALMTEYRDSHAYHAALLHDLVNARGRYSQRHGEGIHAQTQWRQWLRNRCLGCPRTAVGVCHQYTIHANR